jgi:DNA-binding NarL/FixJ family response regulator
VGKSTATVRILLADDHEIVRAGVRMLLEREPGLEVCCDTGNGADVLALLEANCADLLLLDISLPGMSGLKVLQQVKQSRPDLPVIVLTMHGERRWKDEALRAGASGFVVKGSSPQLLLSAIRDALGMRAVERSPLSPRELDVLRLVAAGLTSKEIAGELQISRYTVERHRTNIATKLNLSKRGELIRSAIQFFGSRA